MHKHRKHQCCDLISLVAPCLQGPTWQQAVQWMEEVEVQAGCQLHLVAKHDTYSISFAWADPDDVSHGTDGDHHGGHGTDGDHHGGHGIDGDHHGGHGTDGDHHSGHGTDGTINTGFGTALEARWAGGKTQEATASSSTSTAGHACTSSLARVPLKVRLAHWHCVATPDSFISLDTHKQS